MNDDTKKIAQTIRKQFGDAIDHHRPLPEVEEIASIIESACQKVKLETIAQCRADTEKQICDLQDRFSQRKGEPIPDIKKIAQEAAERIGTHTDIESSASIIESACERAYRIGQQDEGMRLSLKHALQSQPKSEPWTGALVEKMWKHKGCFYIAELHNASK